MDTNDNRLLTNDEACARLAVSRSYLPKLRVYGGGPPFLKLGRAIRYRPGDLDAWLAASARSSTSDTPRNARRGG